jgi:8-oxo-dGTP pyrophosphatase MutT (NUDIX family)
MTEVVAGLAIEHSRVLLVQRWPSPESAWSEKWCCPGGKVEHADYVVWPGCDGRHVALRREWEEEMMSGAHVGELLHVAVRRRPGLPRPYRVWHYAVQCLAPPALAPAGGQRMHWFPAEEVESLDVIAGTCEALASARALGLLE